MGFASRAENLNGTNTFWKPQIVWTCHKSNVNVSLMISRYKQWTFCLGKKFAFVYVASKVNSVQPTCALTVSSSSRLHKNKANQNMYPRPLIKLSHGSITLNESPQVSRENGGICIFQWQIFSWSFVSHGKNGHSFF